MHEFEIPENIGPPRSVLVNVIQDSVIPDLETPLNGPKTDVGSPRHAFQRVLGVLRPDGYGGRLYRFLGVFTVWLFRYAGWLLRRGWKYSVKQTTEGLGQLSLFVTRVYLYYFLASSTKAKCPACGIRKQHKIRWSPVHLKLLHDCARCEARWGESPIAEANSWKVETLVEPNTYEDTPMRPPDRGPGAGFTGN